MNQRPSGYEPDELPCCSTPRYKALPKCFIIITLYKEYVKENLKIKIKTVQSIHFTYKIQILSITYISYYMQQLPAL